MSLEVTTAGSCGTSCHRVSRTPQSTQPIDSKTIGDNYTGFCCTSWNRMLPSGTRDPTVGSEELGKEIYRLDL